MVPQRTQDLLPQPHVLKRLVGAVACALLATACHSGSPADVTLYTSVDQNHAEPVLRDIESRSGLTIAAVYDIEAAKTTGLVNRLLAEQDHPVADVFWSSECLQTLRLQQAGLLSPSKSSASGPSIEHFGSWTAFGGRLRVILVNSNRLSEPESPSSIHDLLSDRWPAERVGLALPLFGTTATHAAALYATRGPREARAFFELVKARGVRVVDGNSTVRDLVSSGELWWGLTDSDDAFGAVARKAPVRVRTPDQQAGGSGTLSIPMSVAVLAGSPHPAGAARLVDELLSAQTLSRLAEQGFVSPLEDPPVRLMRTPWPALLGHFQTAQSELREIFLR